MNHPRLTILRKFGKSCVMLALLTISAGALATLGDGKAKRDGARKSLLSNRTSTPGSFSLKSGYTYRGSQVFTTESGSRYVRLNTVVTVQRGNTVYTVPLKKKAILGKVSIDISNRQLKKN
jgi:hypothetical protein